MVLTQAQTTAFFENAAQMAIPRLTVAQLVVEGIDTADDLAEFDKTSIEAVAHSYAALRLETPSFLERNCRSD